MRLIGFAVVVFVAVQMIEEVEWINNACRMGKARWDHSGERSILHFCTAGLNTREMCLLKQVVCILHLSLYDKHWLGETKKLRKDEPKDRCRAT